MNPDSAPAVFQSPSSEGVELREVSRGSDVPLVLAIGLMWLQLFYSVTPVWIYGQYYTYAWVVPPIASFFFYRRWKRRPRIEQQTSGEIATIAAAIILFPALLLIRALEGFDPSWRLPILSHAGIIALVSHWLVWRRCGRSTSLGMIPVTIFALSAIPYPSRLEHSLIQVLTEWVVQAAGILFELMGRTVIVSGGMLEHRGIKVEVTDGCSGIQSLQSLVMVALCFGEFFRLRTPQRFLLVALAGAVALLVNVGRAIFLARIRFDQSESAFNAAHDGVGHVAFAIGGLCLLIITRILIGRDGKKRKTLRRTQVKST